MNELANHIVSRFKWDSSLDDQRKALELQDRLSDWSGAGMVKEMAQVFDKICPPEQTWRIQTLELDLGTIDFNHLESQLLEKLHRRLKEQLMDLLLYAGRGSRRIEIFNEDSSQLQMIAHFLQYGLMPWSYQSSDGSVNEMLAHQLQTNRRQVIDMLKVVAVIHEDVRKRLAWQIKEVSIVKVIEGLEPNHYAEIIDFSEELSIIQSKETLIHTSYTGFRKQLWLWVLNYLFTDRGTIFNRVAFMKSNIRQMASHYNIGYGELLSAIKRAVVQVQHYHVIRTGFVLALEALVAEDDHEERNDRLFDFWAVLTGHFERGSKGADAGELIFCLSRQDPARFRRAVAGWRKNERGWGTGLGDLNDASLVGHVHFLIALAQQIRLPLDIRTIATLDRYTQLTSVFVKEITRNNASSWSARFKEWLDQLASGTMDNTLRKSLQKNIQCHPKGALEAFLRYPDKRKLRNILPFLLNEGLISLLVKSAAPADRVRVARLIESVNRRTVPVPNRVQTPPGAPASLTAPSPRSAVTPQAPPLPKSAVPMQTSLPFAALSTAARKGSISVRNAGLVLVNSYLKMLLQRLGSLRDNQFTDGRTQEEAVHYLQYIVTGLCYTEESLLPLNKLLCGLPLSHPIEDGLEIPEAHKTLIDGLIQAIIGHWPVIGACSIQGFRGNWLVRDGLLLEQEDRWELTVEKRAYDLLIHQSPFSFSIIKHPWMEKPLHVCWPY